MTEVLCGMKGRIIIAFGACLPRSADCMGNALDFKKTRSGMVGVNVHVKSINGWKFSAVKKRFSFKYDHDARNAAVQIIDFDLCARNDRGTVCI